MVEAGLPEARLVFKEHQDEWPESSNMFGKKRQEQLKDNLGTGRKRHKDIDRSRPHVESKQMGR